MKQQRWAIRGVWAAVAMMSGLGGAACGGDEAAKAGTPRGPEAGVPLAAEKSEDPATELIIDHAVKLLDGQDARLSDWRGHTLLLVNTASQCGLTPQYEELETLWQTYRDRGLVVMGFPSNDFGGQEPGDAREIQEFVVKSFGISFPMFEKQKVKGPDKSPLYRTLTEAVRPEFRGEVKWNFGKFLVDPSGRVVARFEPRVSPLDPTVKAAIEQHLPKKAAP